MDHGAIPAALQGLPGAAISVPAPMALVIDVAMLWPSNSEA
jgi:hypothetical protein